VEVAAAVEGGHGDCGEGWGEGYVADVLGYEVVFGVEGGGWGEDGCYGCHDC